MKHKTHLTLIKPCITCFWWWWWCSKMVRIASSHASYPRSCFLFDSGSGEHMGTGRCVREERQYHQPHVFHQCPLHASWLSSVVSRSIRCRFRLTSWWHQPWDGEDRIRDDKQTARHKGSSVRLWQLHVRPFQCKPGQCLGSRAQWWVMFCSYIRVYKHFAIDMDYRKRWKDCKTTRKRLV
jgi:hypothetical protein